MIPTVSLEAAFLLFFLEDMISKNQQDVHEPCQASPKLHVISTQVSRMSPELVLHHK